MSDDRAKVPMVRLGELLIDSCYGTSELSGASGTTPILGITHVRDGRVRLMNMPRISLSEADARKLALLPGDILVTRTSSFDLVGQSGLVTSDTDAVFASYLVRLRVDKSRVDPAYLNYWLNGPAGRQQVRRVATRAVGQANVNPTELRRLVRVPLPSIARQRRIASSIALWDQAADTTAQLVRSKRSQRDWASRDLLERRRVPGSRRTTLGAVAQIRSGNTPSKSKAEFWDGEHPWVSARDMKTLVVTGSVKRLTDAGYSEASVAPKNSLLVLTRGMTLFKDVPVCIAGADVAFNQDVKALIVEAQTNAVYVAFLLRMHKNDLLGLVDSAGHGTGRLDTEALREFPLLLPPRVTQDEIVETLLTAHREIEVLRSLGAAYENQKRALMSVLFSSEGVDS